MLDMVAPCHPFSKSYRKYWKQFFLKRQMSMFSSVKIYNQSWNVNNGKITFRPSLKRSVFWSYSKSKLKLNSKKVELE